MFDAIESAAETVAAARLSLQEAEHTLKLAQDTIKTLQGRISDRVKRQADITAKRLNGKENKEDAAEFALLDGDLRSLRELERQAREVLAESTTDKQRNALAQAENELQAAQGHAKFEAVAQRVRELEAAYVQCLRALWAAAGDAGMTRGKTFGDVFAVDPTVMALCRYNNFQGLQR